jgi:hypothetical protein
MNLSEQLYQNGPKMDEQLANDDLNDDDMKLLDPEVPAPSPTSVMEVTSIPVKQQYSCGSTYHPITYAFMVKHDRYCQQFVKTTQEFMLCRELRFRQIMTGTNMGVQLDLELLMYGLLVQRAKLLQSIDMNNLQFLLYMESKSSRQSDNYDGATNDNENVSNDHVRASTDHCDTSNDYDDDLTGRSVDHGIAIQVHGIARNDHGIASLNHGMAGYDDDIASNDHDIASNDHVIASNDHDIASNDHDITSNDHDIASNDHDSVSYDHGNASNDLGEDRTVPSRDSLNGQNKQEEEDSMIIQFVSV